MNKDRTYCSSYDCMTRTCSKHRVHLPKWYKNPIIWEAFHEKGCPIYISSNQWKNTDKDGSDNII